MDRIIDMCTVCAPEYAPYLAPNVQCLRPKGGFGPGGSGSHDYYLFIYLFIYLFAKTGTQILGVKKSPPRIGVK